MGTATIAGNTLTSVVDVQRTFKKNVVKHEIPGTASIVQSIGRTRDALIVTGILNPTSEITAVQNIATYSNTTTFAASAVTDVQGTDWAAMNSNTYYVDSVKIKTQKGTRVPWGSYQIDLIESGP